MRALEPRSAIPDPTNGHIDALSWAMPASPRMLESDVAFMSGTEMVALSRVRLDAANYPFVAALKTIAADVSGMLPRPGLIRRTPFAAARGIRLKEL